MRLARTIVHAISFGSQMRSIKVGLNWGMDSYSVSNGQYRYATDLFRSLARLEEPAEYTVFGTRPEPPSDIAELFTRRLRPWKWRLRRHWQGRGQELADEALAAYAFLGHDLDVLHCIDTRIPRFVRCPLVWTLYDVMPEVMPEEREWRESKPWKRYRHAARTRVAMHLAISKTSAEDAIRVWGLDRRRVAVTYLGTTYPPAGFDGVAPGSLIERFGLDRGEPFLCAAYNLYPRKNLDALLDALRRLPPEFSALRLALFGKTGISESRSEWFERTIAAYGLSEAVVRLGFVNDLELADLYRSAAMFVFPSLYEGFGLPLLEAMSVGACVVARNASSMAEVVGDAGMLVETAEGSSLADGIRGLLNDPAERARLGVQGRLRASTFTLERLAQQTFEAYVAVAGAARRR